MTRTEVDTHPVVISHPAHPEHKLQRVQMGGKFTCNGCKQDGKGGNYRCERCDYDIHILCAPTELSLEHPMLENCKLGFRLMPPGPGRWCNACGDDCLGFLYYNGDHDIDLHPRCASLPQEVVIDGVPFKLHTKKYPSLICYRCQQKGARRNSYWSYRSHGNGQHEYVHVGCVTNDSGSNGEIAVSTPTPESAEVLDDPGQGSWYSKIWKFTKIIAKLSFYLITFDATGVFDMAGDIPDCFS